MEIGIFSILFNQKKDRFQKDNQIFQRYRMSVRVPVFIIISSGVPILA